MERKVQGYPRIAEVGGSSPLRSTNEKPLRKRISGGAFSLWGPRPVVVQPALGPIGYPFVQRQGRLVPFGPLLPHDLDDDPLGALAVPLAVEHPLPGAKVQAAIGDRD